VVPRAGRESDSPVTPDGLELGGNTPQLRVEETDYAPPSLPPEDEDEEHGEELHDYIEDLPLTGEKRSFYNQNAILDTRATHNQAHHTQLEINMPRLRRFRHPYITRFGNGELERIYAGYRDGHYTWHALARELLSLMSVN
jgi:hypothetical protein